MQPIPSADNGRHPNGRFAKGNPGGPGRPRRPDLYSVVAARAEASGIDLGEELWHVCRNLLEDAKAGNVQAARLLFGHLCGEQSTESSISLIVETGVPMDTEDHPRAIPTSFGPAAAILRSKGRTETDSLRR